MADSKQIIVSARLLNDPLLKSAVFHFAQLLKALHDNTSAAANDGEQQTLIAVTIASFEEMPTLAPKIAVAAYRMLDADPTIAQIKARLGIYHDSSPLSAIAVGEPSEKKAEIENPPAKVRQQIVCNYLSLLLSQLLRINARGNIDVLLGMLHISTDTEVKSPGLMPPLPERLDLMLADPRELTAIERSKREILLFKAIRDEEAIVAKGAKDGSVFHSDLRGLLTAQQCAILDQQMRAVPSQPKKDDATATVSTPVILASLHAPQLSATRPALAASTSAQDSGSCKAIISKVVEKKQLSDEEMARQLQAELDAEAKKRAPDAKVEAQQLSDAAMARKLQEEFDAEAKKQVPDAKVEAQQLSDAAMAQKSQAELDAEAKKQALDDAINRLKSDLINYIRINYGEINPLTPEGVFNSLFVGSDDDSELRDRIYSALMNNAAIFANQSLTPAGRKFFQEAMDEARQTEHISFTH